MAHESDCDSEYSLSAALENMNIDSDFNVWTSFRGSMGHEVLLSGDILEDNNLEENADIATAPPADEVNPNQKLEQQDKIWSARWRRDEIYSLFYIPSDTEKDELRDLEKSFESTKRFNLLDTLVSMTTAQPEDAQVLSRLLHPSEPPYSILLKRGPCMWERQKQERAAEAEVILLTQGLFVALVATEKKSVSKQLAKAIEWSKVKFIQPSPNDAEKLWQILLEDDIWTFTCSSAKQQQYWLRAFERVLVEYRMRAHAPVELGWQYKCVHKPAFTMAVTDEMDIVRPNEKLLTKRDSYNGYTPLHYAVRCNRPNAVRALLKIGSDPNYPDSDGASSVDHAVRDSASATIVELLRQSGGVFHDVNQGALFGQVASVTEKREKEIAAQKEREIEEKQKADKAKDKMAENLRLVQERGEKINEIGDKASHLNEEASNFRSMAQQLKEKTKQQSKWLPF
ncbi:hypothetical protein FisN_17Lh218 [Fistulifera solaris]|uniref:V-SNARE coiled-coil homology domain-containing protein n=1 Tax=Fistulifera solaris TaxID=1519565 RepID=A0A1Z5KHN6_FISSO|nr:hypothetical protein FisN_17Lh218 [Fistulifera solaris]|eukprot:GAX25824.1 hypothetical protein FisN_17Lh218 [Fistulifera solaris]